MNREHVEWSRKHFNMMADGGGWGVPRSGLMFVRCGNELHLVLRSPHDPMMPVTGGELRKQQDADFDMIKESFGAAGIAVLDKVR
jgi:hypothetical protein